MRVEKKEESGQPSHRRNFADFASAPWEREREKAAKSDLSISDSVFPDGEAEKLFLFPLLHL